MGGREIDIDCGGRPEPLTDDTAVQARRTVAEHATDADDCRSLLQMLGLWGDEPRCSKCAGLMSRPSPEGDDRSGGGAGLCWQCAPKPQQAAAVRCACGRLAVAGGQECGICRDRVPADWVRDLVAAIKAHTGYGTKRIADMSGIGKNTLGPIIIPSSTRDHVAVSMYESLVDLAVRCGL